MEGERKKSKKESDLEHHKNKTLLRQYQVLKKEAEAMRKEKKSLQLATRNADLKLNRSLAEVRTLSK